MTEFDTREELGRDRILDRWVHWSLLSGLIACGAFLVLGLVLTFLRHESAPEGPPPPISRLIRLAIGGDGPSLIFLGLLTLLATPLLRVIVLTVGWFYLGDRRFALVAGAVFVLLAIGVYLGVA